MDINDTEQWFPAALKELGITLSLDQTNQFERYYEELIQWNDKVNLTAITDRGEVYLKHFYDSLTVYSAVDLLKSRLIVDIGSGAGFPGIPLKIVFPHLKLTIIESLNKRVLFLQSLCEKLCLSNVQVIHARAEDAARLDEHRDRYDLALARAVARLAVLNELCLPFVTKGGHFVAMKGGSSEDEVSESAFSAVELNAKLIVNSYLELPIQPAGRSLIVFEKMNRTPSKYPRKAGTPNKTPLVPQN
ncbi:MAG: rsmG [Paenibacillaceae bacterium]|jgi:16S rRNA (guanine527-N7)-methyltransferase|nr:rsmG [Paenibacillaceae bacterium]